MLVGAVLLFVLTAAAPPLSAQDRPPVAIALPAQPLGQALVDLAEQTGVTIIAPAALVAGKSAPALSGRLAPREAVRRLLVGSGLAARTGTGGAIIVTAAPSGGPMRLGPVTVEAVLEGTVTDSYAAPDSFSATRTDTPLIETPQSAQSISRQALEDTGAETLADAYDYLAGITRDNTQGGLQGDEYLARGFETENVLFNGNRTSSASTLDTANVERIEALRGPTAALFGKADPGGLVNIITKQPLSAPFREITGAAATGLGGEGSRLRRGRTSVDFGGPLSEDGRLRYRFNAALEYEDSFRRDVDERLAFVAPVLDYRLDDETIVNVELAYQHREDTFDRGVFFVNDALVLPRDFNIAEGNVGGIDKDYASGTVRLEHRFTPGWRARLGLYGSDDVRDGDGVQQGGVLGNIARRQRREVEATTRFLTAQPEIVGEFSTGAVGHTVLIGTDLQHERREFTGFVGPRGGAIDVFDPDFSIPVPAIDRTLSAFGSFLFDSRVKGESIGVYLQDQIELSERWKLLLGARYDHVDLDFRTIQAFNFGTVQIMPSEATFTDSNLSPRAGIVFQPAAFASIYASYSESYRPPATNVRFTTSEGGAVDAETARNYEAGIKLETPNGRLSGTLAVYRADKKNVIEADPSDPFGMTGINLGKVRGQGVEFDLAGELTENLSLGASYAFTDVRTDVSTPALPSGTRLRNVPKHAASLLLAYRFPQGPLAGLRLFGSLFYEDEKRTDTSATIRNELPSFLRLNAGLQYDIRPGVSARFSVENLTDVTYYTSAAGRLNVEVGDPRSLLFELRARF